MIDECDLLLSEAADRFGCDMGDVWRDVMGMRAQLWVCRDDAGVRSALITAMQDDDCTLWLMSGEMQDLQWLPQIEQAAREGGAKAMLIIGRKGWGRVLQGYERIDDMDGHAAFRKVL